MTIDDLGEKLDGVATTVDGLVVKVDNLETKFVKLGMKVDNLETKTDRLENKLDTVAASVDDLALITQRSFDGLEERMATKDDLREGLLGLKNGLKEDIDLLGGRIASLEERMVFSERHSISLEEKMENGFTSVIAEIQDIRRELKLVDRREQVDELDGRVTILERKISTG